MADAAPKLVHTAEIRIDKGVPIARSRGRHMLYPLREMEVGDSFFCTGKKLTNVANAAWAQAKRMGDGRRFTSRSVIENGVKGVRCWRIA